ncbi:MAG TPA: helix-turn-helix domain-containing protein [Nocardioidaceae bacterium]|jgi:transcriptional regulator with XRE-family HTH domain|nr:helix-turn-helix domain-containing protein [Nocardioidaceae bacterium]
MSTIGTRVRELRIAKGLSQQALAGDGISAGYVSLIESGKRTPSGKAVQRLAERLGVPVDQLLEVGAPAAEHARLEANFARLSLANGNPAEAVRTLSAIRFQELDSGAAGEASLVLAEALQETGDLDRAVGVLEALIERCRREQSWVVLASAATALAAMYIESGDTSHSAATARAALDEVEAAGLEGTDDHIRLGSVYVWALVEGGDLLFAARRVELLIDVAERLGSMRARGSIYWNAALVAHQRGHISEAIRLTDRAVAMLGEQEDSRDLPRLRMHYAWLLLNHPEPHAVEALRQLDRAEANDALAGSTLDLGMVAAFRGRAHLLLGELDTAAEHAAQALILLGPSEHVERVSALLLLGDVESARLDSDVAREAYGEAERVLGQMVPSRKIARLFREVGDAWRELGDLTRAAQAYDRSLTMVGLAARPAVSRAHVRQQPDAHTRRAGSPKSVRVT